MKHLKTLTLGAAAGLILGAAVAMPGTAQADAIIVPYVDMDMWAACWWSCAPPRFVGTGRCSASCVGREWPTGFSWSDTAFARLAAGLSSGAFEVSKSFTCFIARAIPFVMLK